MAKFIDNPRFRKFAPIDQEYPILELVEGNSEDIIFDMTATDDGEINVCIEGKLFPYVKLQALLAEGRELLLRELE